MWTRCPRTLIEVLTTALIVTGIACSGDDVGEPTLAAPTETIPIGTTPEETIEPSNELEVLPSKDSVAIRPVTIEPAASILAFERGRGWGPMAAVGDAILLQGRSLSKTNDEPSLYELWDPTTGERTPLWEGLPGRQDAVAATYGTWIATTRVGYELPFAEWELILRNAATGEAITVAVGDASVVEVPGLNTTNYTGLAPDPALSETELVWDEFYRNGTGAGKRIQAFDLETRTITTLLDIPDATVVDVRAPAAGGGRIAWVRTTGLTESHPAAFVDVRDISGDVQSFRMPSIPFVIALADTEPYLYWDDSRSHQNATNLKTLQTITIAEGVGTGVYLSGDYVGWAPQTNVGFTRIGYYSIAENTTYLHAVDSDNARATLGWPLGPWFAWNVLVSSQDQPNDPTLSFVYVARLADQQ